MGRESQARIIAVGHDDGPYETRRHAPGGLPDILKVLGPVLETDIERLGKMLAKIMGGAHLKGFAVRHHRSIA